MTLLAWGDKAGRKKSLRWILKSSGTSKSRGLPARKVKMQKVYRNPSRGCIFFTKWPCWFQNNSLLALKSPWKTANFGHFFEHFLGIFWVRIFTIYGPIFHNLDHFWAIFRQIQDSFRLIFRPLWTIVWTNFGQFIDIFEILFFKLHFVSK